MGREPIQKDIAELVRFGAAHGLLEEGDRIPATNALIDLLETEEPYDGELQDGVPETAVPILERILDYAAEKGIIPENTVTRRDLLDARIMGLLMPRQSEVARTFWRIAEEESIERATDAFYAMSIASNYIRMDRIRRNRYWEVSTDYGNLEITVNLSRPEKDPKDIAAERSLPQSDYPKCLLCVENVGYAGRLNHPARQNHRVIPLELDGQEWFFQYSPYVYYNEHSIIFSREHRPMKIGRSTFVRLLDFIETFPHYFIGSNADLPIVGGSILNHDHFQGGRHVFPMEKAPVERRFTHPSFPRLQVGIVKWPMSVIRVSGPDRAELVEFADHVLDAWKRYNDEQAGILAYSTAADGSVVPHNTITPIARRNGAGEFELDLVLRNNRTSAEHPLGIFHPHADLHHIKKENIGLIEVMGLAVLPGRLQDELGQIGEILTGENKDDGWKQEKEHPLYKHTAWLLLLAAKYGDRLTPEEAEAALKNETGLKFLQVLNDSAVYKRDAEGAEAFARFLSHLGCRE